LDIRANDVFVNWVPLYHGLGLIRFVFGPVFFGCPSHLVPASLASLRVWLETITRVRGTITGGTDFGYRMAAERVDPRGLDLSALRVAINSGEPVKRSTIEQFEQRFGLSGVVRPGYGLTEANGVSVLARGEPLRADHDGNLSCGRPVEGLTAEIVDSKGATLPPGAAGQIRLFGEQVFAGYFEDEAATRDVLRDGWLHTGDIGTLDADGHLYVTGRMRSLIKRGGAMIVPREIETVVERVAGVAAAAAIGIPRESATGTEDVVVVAELTTDQRPADSAAMELVRAIADAMNRSLRFAPSKVLLVRPNSIPRTSNGKIRHEELKRLLASDEPSRLGLVFGS
jgi:acyl-CoA synthetase (AMP-forming)/AMP-acid ligase II